MVPFLKNLIWLPQISMFQINRGDDDSTVAEPRSATELEQEFDSSNFSNRNSAKRELTLRFTESILIFLCFALVSGQLPPDVNESHYLTKSKHFWDPEWCAGDIFLASSFAHWFFYLTTGWLTKIFSLSVTAWIGRTITWALMAFAWQRLSWKLLPSRGLAVLSAIFFLLLNERFHLAGEWVVGGFEAKGIAYFFVILALGNMVNRDWKWVWPALGAAAAFHVLVGGWAFISAIFACGCIQWVGINSNKKLWLVDSFNRAKSYVLPFVAGSALCLIGLIPPLLADSSADPETSTAARMIYVNHRIAHHLTFDAFPTMHVARFALICVLSFLLHSWIKARWQTMYNRFRVLSYFCLASLIISFGGLILSGMAEQNDELAVRCAGLLRFYWFRLSDFAVPMTSAMACCLIIALWMKTDKRLTTRISCLIFTSCIVAAGGVIVVEKNSDSRPRADRKSLPTYDGNADRTMGTFRNWKKVCQWINANTPQDATFITPHEQQTFKWYSGRSEVVCWKDIPQDAHGVLDWSKRLTELYEPQRRYEEGLMSYSDEQLVEIAKRYQATHLLVPQRQIDLAVTPPNLKQIYPVDPSVKSTYVVLEF